MKRSKNAEKNFQENLEPIKKEQHLDNQLQISSIFTLVGKAA